MIPESAVRMIQDVPSLLGFLREELEWPLPSDPTLDEVTFDWTGDDLRLSEETTRRFKGGVVRQLRPFRGDQPWGVFLVEFNDSRVYATALRQVLRRLVPNRRQDPSRPAWCHENLLFLCTTADQQFTFAHFRGEKPQRAKLITFRWSPEEPIRTLCEFNLPALRFPEDGGTDVQMWLKEWQSAFDVEKVTEKFFEDYRKVFEELQKCLHRQTNDPGWAHPNALQLLNRLMFLYFIQRKRWLGENPRFLRRFWEAYKASGSPADTFFENWLSVLFFEAFTRTFQAGRADYRQRFPEDIRTALQMAPFLNGGLFIWNELDDRYAFTVEDAFFETLFDRFDGTSPGFLERYNFTITESTPLDQEVAVDPEMIGKVYESLVNLTFEGTEAQDQRGTAGIFYTPRVEIDLMCRLSLVDWLTNHLGEERKSLLYEAVFAYDPGEKNAADRAIMRENLWPDLNRLLREVTVLDPACGSGSFLVGMLSVLDDLQARANAQLGLEETSYERRKRIIGRSLYGVDVMSWAVHVAELRLWLQLVIETELEPAELQFRPLLPNLSFKVRPGDSLVQEIGRVNFGLHRQHLEIPSYLQGRLTRLKGEKLKFYSGDAKAGIRSEAFLKQEELRLFREILDAKSQALTQRLKRIYQLEETRPDLLGEERRVVRAQTARTLAVEKEQLEMEREPLLRAREALRTATEVPFVWDIAFVEIFEGDKGGFDIVMGNPPYVRQEKIAPPELSERDFEVNAWRELKKTYKEKLQRSVAMAYPRFFGFSPASDKFRKLDSKSDLYVYFYLHGLSLLNEKGTFCFITSNSWLDVGYGKDLQEFLLKHSHVKMILDNQARRSFAQADVNTVIPLLAPPNDRKLDGLEKTARFVMFKVPFEEALSPVIFEEIESVGVDPHVHPMDRLVRPEFRVLVRSQQELYEEGVEQPKEKGRLTGKRAKYTGNKWGGKYLRAPDIFFTILEKGKGKLVRLGDIAQVNEGRPTGANEFFYVRKQIAQQFRIEKEFLHPGLMKTRGANKASIGISDIDRYFLSVTVPPEKLQGRNVLAYIRYGEQQGLHHRNTFRGKPLWYAFRVRPPADLFLACGIGATFFCARNEAGAVSSNSFTELRLKNEAYRGVLWGFFNSAIGWLTIEIHGRSSLGGGLLKVDPIEYRQMQAITTLMPAQKERLLVAFEQLKGREVRSVFEELGLSKPNRDYNNIAPNDVSLDKILPDRRALDEVVFEVLGLTEAEQLEVYRAVVELVKNRLVKARSV